MKKMSVLSLSLLLSAGVVLSPLAAQGERTYRGADNTAIADYNRAASQYTQAFNFYTSARRNYETARGQYLKSRTPVDQKAALEQARSFLETTINTTLSYLNMIEAKVKTAKGISETDRASLLADIASDRAWFEAEKVKVQNATTKEQLTSEANEAKRHWILVRIHAKRIIGALSLARIDWVIVKDQEAATVIQDQINVFKGQGKDTASAEALLTDFNAKIALAEAERDRAKAKYDAIGAADSATLAELEAELREANKLAEEANAFIRKASDYLVQAHKDLKDITRNLRGLPAPQTAGDEQ